MYVAMMAIKVQHVVVITSYRVEIHAVMMAHFAGHQILGPMSVICIYIFIVLNQVNTVVVMLVLIMVSCFFPFSNGFRYVFCALI